MLSSRDFVAALKHVERPEARSNPLHGYSFSFQNRVKLAFAIRGEALPDHFPEWCDLSVSA